MEVHEDKHGAVTVLRPDGPLVEDDVSMFCGKLTAVRQNTMGRLVLDLSETPFVDSKGLEALLDATEAMEDCGQSLRLCGVNETVREVLELTEISSFFEHYEDVNSAVRSFL